MTCRWHMLVAGTMCDCQRACTRGYLFFPGYDKVQGRKVDKVAAFQALPAPGLLGDVVDQGPTAKAQLIASLGFVVVECFHGPLGLFRGDRKAMVTKETPSQPGMHQGARGERLGLQRHLLARAWHC